jgi:leucine dehydrogenase
MERSLFIPLDKENLTTLFIYYNWRKDAVALRSAREWEGGVDWSRYGKDFTFEDALTNTSLYLGNQETWDIFKKYDLTDYLDEVINLLRKGRHQGIECFYNKENAVHFISNMHSNVLGIKNGYHAIRSGGIRRHEPEEDELGVIIDGLNLSRAMSFKNAGAQIPFGGSKITVQCRPLDLSDFMTIGFLAYALDRTRSFTGPDMGFSPELADVMRREGYSMNIAGGFDSKIGPTGAPTAYGVYLAIKEAVRFKFGKESLKGMRIVVQGAGAVGYPLVEKYLAKEGAMIFVSDTRKEPVEELIKHYPQNVREIDNKDIYTFNADIFAPCAMGGILDEEHIKGLKYSIVMGAANNQLTATSEDEEIRLSKELAKRDILFQVSWMHNTGGVIAGMEEYINREKADINNVMSHTEKVCREGVRENFYSSKKDGLTPTERAYNYYGSKIYPRYENL